MVLHLNKLESPLDALWQVWLKLAQWFKRRRFLNFLNVFFCYFVIISPWKRVGPVIWKKNFNPLHPRLLCAKFGWNWFSGSWGEDFYIFVNVFLLFQNYLPLEKSGGLHLNKLESFFSKRMLCAKFGWNWSHGSWEDFLNFVNVFCYFVIISPFKKGGALYLYKFEFPLPKDALYWVWLQLVQWLLRRRFFKILSMLFNYFVITFII